MDNIVTLCSGGFDSICLMYYLKEEYPKDNVTAVFFSYGQKSLEEEKRCTENICKKLGYKLKEIKLPEMNWSNSGLIKDNSNVYLEMRNLIFLSYGISIAESLKADKLFTAFIKPDNGVWYSDTSPQFLHSLNTISNTVGVEVIAPFQQLDKEDLVYYVHKYCIEREDFWSCVKTEEITGEPCGNCAFIEDMYKTLVEPEWLNDLFCAGKYDKMREVIKNTPIISAKLFINDICNMHCKFCLTNGHSFKGNTIQYYIDVIKHLRELGIKKIDIMGKEPFIDESIFKIIEGVHKEGINDIDYVTITNGKNLLKYKEQIKEVGFKSITLSYDGNVLRESLPIFEDKEFFKKICEEFPIQISFDLHKANYRQAEFYIRYLLECGVKFVYIKPILDYSNDTYYQVSDKEFIYFLLRLEKFLRDSDCVDFVMVDIPKNYPIIGEMFATNYQKNPIVSYRVDYDAFCIAGVSSVFVTCDGNVYGCGDCLYSNDKMEKKNIFNFKTNKELKDFIVTSGKRMCNPIA